MPTTLSDNGRVGKHVNIPFYYAFPVKQYFRSHQIMPDDVLTWCRENCRGFYKVVSYTHEHSKRDRTNPAKLTKKVVYVDRIYLSELKDAVMIRLIFDVVDTKVKRPKLKTWKKSGRKN